MKRIYYLIQALLLYGVLTEAGIWGDKTVTNIMFHPDPQSRAREIALYAGQILGSNKIIVIAGALFAITWALCSPHDRLKAAGWYLRASLTAIAATLGLMLLSIPFEFADCGSTCVWYVGTPIKAVGIALLTATFWGLLTLLVYRYMVWIARRHTTSK